MVWTAPITNDAWDISTGQTAITLTAGTVGDLRVIEFLTQNTTISVSSLSGGGVTTWARAGSVNTVSAADAVNGACTAETWYGTVTSTGTALAVTYSASIGATLCAGCHSDFRSLRLNKQAGNVYTVVANTFAQAATGTAGPLSWFPSATTRDNQLVTGHASTSGAAGISGSTTGYSYYLDTPNAMYHTYRLQCAAVETEAPTMTYTGTSGWYTELTIFDDGYNPPPLKLNQARNRATSW